MSPQATAPVLYSTSFFLQLQFFNRTVMIDDRLLFKGYIHRVVSFQITNATLIIVEIYL